MAERYRVLAIDFGARRVGIALSDELRMLASPRGVFENDKRLLQNLEEMIVREGVRLVLVGIPRTLANSDSAMTTQVHKFKEELTKRLEPLGVPVLGRDERLTSVMANFNISQRGLPKMKRETKSLRDEEAARILLQEYLDSAS